MAEYHDDMARCRGIGNDEDGWHEDCRRCARWLADCNDDDVWFIEPPQTITFWCVNLIEVDEAQNGR